MTGHGGPEQNVGQDLAEDGVGQIIDLVHTRQGSEFPMERLDFRLEPPDFGSIQASNCVMGPAQSGTFRAAHS